MSLDEYERRRDFGVTPEPRADTREAAPWNRFVLHRHDASHIHYDLRLEAGGTLRSWAVPRGLATPHDTRKLAVMVEDHPVEYLDFEGEIPAGQYGAGTMAIWDRGRYEATGGFEDGLQKGKLTLRLRGDKVDGEFSLVRMKDRDWLIILHKPESLNPDLKTAGVAAPMPAAVDPMLAVLAGRPFDSQDYSFEIKFDGMRAIASVDARGTLSIMSRNRREQSRRYPELAGLAGNFLAAEFVVDGEITALDERGVTRFQLLQERLNLTGDAGIERAARKTPAFYYVFDLLYLDGRDLTGLTLDERRGLLERVILPHKHVLLSETFATKGTILFEAARENGLEGIVAKRRASPYRQKRSRDWLKIKVVHQQEFVIGGFTAPGGSRRHFGALMLGLYEGDELVYVGSVGTGFTEAVLEGLASSMAPLATTGPPFRNPPAGDGHTWVRPELVAEVRFAEWTREGSLRQPVFLGLRDDIDPRECVREREAGGPPGAGEAGGEGRMRTRPVVLPPLPAGAGGDRKLSAGGREVALSHLDKVFWPREGYTKRDLIDYYYRVSEFIIPHLEDRPLTLKRYPDGFGSEPFFQKEAPPETPAWIRVESIYSEERQAGIDYIVCDDLPTLMFLANIGCISQNPWLSSAANLDNPDHIVFDLDPTREKGGDFSHCVEAALLVREKLTLFGLRGYPKTSGASGMHVYVPVKPAYSFEQARQFARVIAILCRQERPDLVTLEPSRARRDAPLYLDILQNVRGKTMASVYSVRSREGAPVAAPLSWEEVVPGLRPGGFTIAVMPGRLAREGDLFSGVLTDRQDLLLAIEAGEKYLGGG